MRLRFVYIKLDPQKVWVGLDWKETSNKTSFYVCILPMIVMRFDAIY